MKRTARLPLLLALLALAGVPGLLPSAARPASAAPEPVYFALGDSIAAGLITTLPRERGYPALVGELLRRASGNPAQGVRLVNLAVAGETAASFQGQGQLGRFRDEVAALPSQGGAVRAVTVSLGGNDLLRLAEQGPDERQRGLERFQSEFPAALTAIRAVLGEARPVMVVTTYYDLSESDPSQEGTDGWWLARFNQVIRDTAAAQGARVADLAPTFRGRIDDWTWHPTDVHPNNDGHVAIARLVWQAMGIDAAAPMITLERPNGGPLARPVPTIRARVSDDVAVDRVELWVDGQAVAELIYIAREDAYVGIWDGRGRGAGNRQVELAVRARDRAGNEAQASVTVTLPGT